ncbi:uncharacterized protein RHOBADRAFT_66094, partial [Rhodotorula graminis WP1]
TRLVALRATQHGRTCIPRNRRHRPQGHRLWPRRPLGLRPVRHVGDPHGHDEGLRRGLQGPPPRGGQQDQARVRPAPRGLCRPAPDPTVLSGALSSPWLSLSNLSLVPSCLCSPRSQCIVPRP